MKFWDVAHNKIVDESKLRKLYDKLPAKEKAKQSFYEFVSNNFVGEDTININSMEEVLHKKITKRGPP